ncbi:hypothetical protein DSO57_1035954 [Entomophthora muscae]|uniref:Uncharacterized protein n=1 Tax=Entomophthora muscae TaxID=34485 RepID=A0ACC2RQD0_9FUNG|nr:hypothetical protein DSO57_1035954 [Entomophthora muscae]
MEDYNRLKKRFAELGHKEISIRSPITVSVSFTPIVYEQTLGYCTPRSILTTNHLHDPFTTKSCAVVLKSGIPDGLLSTDPYLSFTRRDIHRSVHT